jgi:hypothetical protein
VIGDTANLSKGPRVVEFEQILQFCKIHRAHYMEISTHSQFNVRALVEMIAIEYYQIAEEKEGALAEPLVTTGLKVELYLWLMLVWIGNSLYKYLDFSPILTLAWLINVIYPLSIIACLPIAGVLYYFLGYFFVAWAMKM